MRGARNRLPQPASKGPSGLLLHLHRFQAEKDERQRDVISQDDYVLQETRRSKDDGHQ